MRGRFSRSEQHAPFGEDVDLSYPCMNLAISLHIAHEHTRFDPNCHWCRAYRRVTNIVMVLDLGA